MKGSRWLAAVLALILACTAVPVTVRAEEGEQAQEEEQQEEKLPRQDLETGEYLISTADQLFWAAKQVNSGRTDLKLRLTACIDLGGRAWTPIGSMSHPFSGHLDGQGHTVSGLAMTGSTDAAGLFGCTLGAEIEHVMVSGSMTLDSADYAGGLAGFARDTFFIKCRSEVDITCGGQADVGGLVGREEEGIRLWSCGSWGSITGSYNVGGLLGCFVDGYMDICGSYNMGTICSDSTEGASAGGLIGLVAAGVNSADQIRACYSVGAVTAKNGFGGLLYGRFEDPENLPDCLSFCLAVSGSGKMDGEGRIDAGESAYGEKVERLSSDGLTKVRESLGGESIASLGDFYTLQISRRAYIPNWEWQDLYVSVPEDILNEGITLTALKESYLSDLEVSETDYSAEDWEILEPLIRSARGIIEETESEKEMYEAAAPALQEIESRTNGTVARSVEAAKAEIRAYIRELGEENYGEEELQKLQTIRQEGEEALDRIVSPKNHRERIDKILEDCKAKLNEVPKRSLQESIARAKEELKSFRDQVYEAIEVCRDSSMPEGIRKKVDQILKEQSALLDGILEGADYSAIRTETDLAMTIRNMQEDLRSQGEVGAGLVRDAQKTYQEIGSAEEWLNYVAEWNRGESKVTSVVLTEDLNLTSKDWEPLGNSDHPFAGSIYGQGHAVTLELSVSGNGSYGLVGYGKKLTVTDLTVKLSANITGRGEDTALGALAGSVVKGGSLEAENCFAELSLHQSSTYARKIGGLVGYGGGSLRFLDCSTDGSMEIVASSSTLQKGIGGLAGWSEGDVHITDSQNRLSIGLSGKASFGGVGGLVGYCSNGQISITDCINDGAVDGSSSGKSGSGFGGFTGLLEYTTLTVERSLNRGSVEGPGTSAGGVAGFAGKMVGAGYPAVFRECANRGAVSCGYRSGASLIYQSGAAGIIAGAAGVCTLENVYNAGFVRGKGYVAGIAANLSRGGSVKNAYNVGGVIDSTGNAAAIVYFSGSGYSLTEENCFALQGSADFVNRTGDFTFSEERDLVTTDFAGTLGSAFQAGFDEEYPYPVFNWETVSGDLETIRQRWQGSLNALQSEEALVQYFEPQKAQIREYAKEGMKNIGAASTEAEIYAAYRKAKGKIEAVVDKKTVEENLEKEQKRVEELLEAYLKPENYTETVRQKLEEKQQETDAILSEGRKKVSEVTAESYAADETAVEKAAAETFSKLDMLIQSCGGWDGSETEKPERKGGVWQLGSAAELAWFRDYVAEGHTEESAVLTADLDMCGQPFGGIGTSAEPFSGSFDGAGHRIDGLSDNLFVKLGGTREVPARVTDLTIAGHLEGDEAEKGALATYAGSVILTRIISECTLVKTGNNYQGSRGGLVGRLTGNAMVAGCVFRGSIGGTNAGYNCGGIAGLVSGAQSLILYCRNEGTVCGYMYGGGIAGTVTGGAQIADCENSGAVTIQSAYAGGIAGWLYGRGGTNTEPLPSGILRCINSGAVSSTSRGYGESYTGGIVGLLGFKTTSSGYTEKYCPSIREAYNEGTVTSNKGQTGGIVGCFSEGRLQNLYMKAGSADTLLGELSANSQSAEIAGDYAVVAEGDWKGSAIRGWENALTGMKAGRAAAIWQDWLTMSQAGTYGDAQYGVLLQLALTDMEKLGNADSESAVVQADREIREGLVGVPTGLEEFRQEALQALRGIIDGKIYTADAKKQAESCFDQAKEAIRKAESQTEAANLRDQYAAEIRSIRSYTDQALSDLASVRQNLKLQNTYTEQAEKLLDRLWETACQQIEAAESAAEIDLLVINARADMKRVDPSDIMGILDPDREVELEAAKEAALQQIREAAEEKNGLSESYQTRITELVQEAETAVGELTNGEKVRKEAEETIKAIIDLKNRAVACGWDGEKLQEPERDQKGIYRIGTAGELAWFAAEVNRGTQADAVLTKDVELGGYEWIPIGTNEQPYRGSFDGNGHKISGLYISQGERYLGLFGKTEQAEVKNLTVEGEILRSSDTADVGGIVGYAKNSVFEACVNRTDLQLVIGRGSGQISHVGGVAGYALNTSFTACTNYGSVAAQSVLSGAAGTGGIVGYQIGEAENESCELKNCLNFGNISSGNQYVGGIAGRINDWSREVSGCANHGEVRASSENADYIGGIIGGISCGRGQVLVENCYNAALVAGIAQSKTGGILGAEYGNVSGCVTLKNCYDTGEVRGNTYSGLMAGYSYGGNYYQGLLVLDSLINRPMGYPCINGYRVKTLEEEKLKTDPGLSDAFLLSYAGLNGGYPFLSQELETADGWREQVCSYLEQYLSEEDFDKQQWKEIKAMTEAARTAIEGDATAEQIRADYEKALEQLQSYLEQQKAETLKKLQEAAKKNYPAFVRKEVQEALKEAEQSISEAESGVGVKAAADRFYAGAADAVIQKIGTVTAGSGELLKQARSIYDSLTEDQQLLVVHYGELLDMEAAYAEFLKQAETEKNGGKDTGTKTDQNTAGVNYSSWAEKATSGSVVSRFGSADDSSVRAGSQAENGKTLPDAESGAQSIEPVLATAAESPAAAVVQAMTDPNSALHKALLILISVLGVLSLGAGIWFVRAQKKKGELEL